MNPAHRPWTTRDRRVLAACVGRLSHAEIAARLGRSMFAVRAYCLRHGYARPAFWSAADRATVRRLYRKVPAAEIARRLGRTFRAVHQCARAMGLHTPQRFRAPDMESFVRERNADGWPDAEIARARGVERHAVAHLRKRLGLPSNQFSARRRAAVAARTAEQLRRAGLPSIGHLRVQAFRARARAAGWPDDLRPRAVQILNLLWERGPQTRRQIADAIGMRWKGSRNSLTSNDPEGTYLAHLVARGLVVDLGRVGTVRGQGKGRSVHVYSLPLTIERNIA